MIITRMRYGLGNQLFEYAAGFALSRRLDIPLKMDCSYYLENDEKKPAHEKYMLLQDYQISGEMATAKECNTIINRKASWKLARRCGWKRPSRVISEKRLLAWQLKLHDLYGDWYLKGVWPFEEYFQSYSSDLVVEYTLRTHVPGTAISLIQEISERDSIGIHIRMGDKDVETGMPKYLPDLQYYYRAINYALKLGGNPTVYIFSNNPQIAEEIWEHPYPVTYVKRRPGWKDYVDLELMSQCKKLIITNSTFSWWAGWMIEERNKHSSRLVIAPKNWIFGGKLESKRCLRPRWVGIKNDVEGFAEGLVS
jgi:hypothetical protein